MIIIKTIIIMIMIITRTIIIMIIIIIIKMILMIIIIIIIKKNKADNTKVKVMQGNKLKKNKTKQKMHTVIYKSKKCV